MTGLGALVYAPVSEWSAQMPVLMERLDEKLSPIRRGLQDAQRTAEQIEQATEIEPGAGPTTVVVEDGSPLLSQFFAQSRLLLGQIAATAILTFFLLATGDPLISDRFLTRFGSPGQILIRSLEKATHQMSRYISTMTILNASVGVLCGLVAYFAGLPSPILWGLAIAVLNFVPYLGPLVAALAVAVVSFLTFDSFWQTAVPVLLIITIQFLEGEVLTPMILGRVMELHPVAIIVSVLIWGWMWGLAGAFLAVPILMTGAIIMNELFADGEQRPEDCQAVTESPQRRRRKAS
jgi:predicted PurR-regulated permease PerM